MYSAIRIAVAAALSFTSLTLAHAQSADVEKRQVVALADTGAVRWSADVNLDPYAGRYVAEDGQTFSIMIEDEELTLESPATWGLPALTLHALDAQSFAAAAGELRVTFAFAADGAVSGASLYRDTERAVVTSRIALRGIVTILDVSDVLAASTIASTN
jgi:hypothetical protein